MAERLARNGWRLVVVGVLVAGVIACRPAQRDTTPEPVAPGPDTDGSPRVVVDATTRFQTMSGWEATAQSGQDRPTFLSYRDRLFDQAVDDLGIDRIRVEVRSGSESSSDNYGDLLAGRINNDQWRPIRYATVNDNGDPFSLNMAGFWWTELDSQIQNVILPLRQRLEARGRRLSVHICYVAFTGQIPAGGQYHHQNAEEYAEFVQAVFTHLQDRFNLTPDGWEMHLEPDNTTQWTPAFMRQAIVATGNRLAAMGLSPRLIAPSTTNMERAIEYANAIAQGGVPRFWSELSYHRYSGVSAGALQTLAARAQQFGIRTSMLEHIGSGYETLHDDLKVGQVTAWQQFALGSAGPPDDGGGTYFLVDGAAGTVAMASRTKFLAQYFRYVRIGAVRVGATTSDGTFDPVAFVNPDNKAVVVVKAERGGTFVVQGLPAGSYEITSTTAAAAGVRLGSSTVTASDRLRVTIAERGVVTISAS